MGDSSLFDKISENIDPNNNHENDIVKEAGFIKVALAKVNAMSNNDKALVKKASACIGSLLDKINELEEKRLFNEECEKVARLFVNNGIIYEFQYMDKVAELKKINSAKLEIVKQAVEIAKNIDKKSLSMFDGFGDPLSKTASATFPKKKRKMFDPIEDEES